MLEAITYQDVLNYIKNNRLSEDTIGILITRPDLDTGKSILKSLNYYHHLSGENMNFFLPGYGAYWYGNYSDGRVVTTIDGVEWSYSDKMFVKFTKQLETNCKWCYSGESELLLLEYKNNEISYDKVLRFYLDNMLRDDVILSVPSFFQSLFRLCIGNNTLNRIGNDFGKNGLIQVTSQMILDNVPKYFGKMIMQEKYFCTANYTKHG